MKKVIIKYNNISHLDAAYQQRVLDLANFYQQLPYQHNFMVIDSTDLDRTFALEVPADTDWVVVVAAGHTTQDRNLYYDLVNVGILHRSPLVCHIMNFPDQYPHLHPQIFAVNFQTWRSMGSPVWAHQHRPYDFVSTEFEASALTFHDNYTPIWLKPLTGTRQYTGAFLQQGAEVIRACLDHGYKIMNIPQWIRDCKHHLYPDQDSEAFGQFLAGGAYNGQHPAQIHYVGLIAHLADQVQRQYYVLNTEPLTTIPAGTHIDHYAGVASGLKLFCTMVKNGFDANTAVTVFDFSDIALKFQKYLIDSWSGTLANYEIVCRQFEDQNPGHHPCLPSGAWSDTYDHILRELNLSPEEFRVKWNEYCHREHRFEKINLYDSEGQQRLVNICANYDQSYVWVSNAFWMEYSLIKLGKDCLRQIRQNFIDNITSSGADIILDTNDHWHQGLLTFAGRPVTITH
jgi:hypothetical protein